jgi:hypothetical protein
MKKDDRAPRFHAYFKHVEGRSVFTMPLNTWFDLRGHEDIPVQIDVSMTPIGAVAQNASVVAAVATNIASSQSEVHIYRYDPKDKPTPINLDKYAVWQGLPDHRDYIQMVNAASTNDDANLRAYLDENVFIVKIDPGPDHWLPKVPSSVIALVSPSSGSVNES